MTMDVSKRRKIKAALSVFPAAAQMGLTLTMALGGRPSVGSKLPDEAIHLLAYLVLVILIYIAVRNVAVSMKRNSVIKSSAFMASIFSFIDEALQHLTPSRSAQLSDLVADNLGVMLGTVLLFSVQHFLKEKSNDQYH